MPSIRAYCDDCDRYVRASKEKTVNHVLHLLLTVLTCGLWAVIWLLAGAASLSERYRCPRCGNVVHAD